ncbi:MAG: macro domain-containing protein, partial [Gemmataceae bacterium]
IVKTGSAHCPHLVHAPTMRVPGSIGGTDNVYRAAWAALLEVVAHNAAGAERIETVAFPAFGTGFGGMAFDEAARQMAVAYRNLLQPPHRLDWDFVVERQQAIHYDEGRKVC